MDLPDNPFKRALAEGRPADRSLVHPEQPRRRRGGGRLGLRLAAARHRALAQRARHGALAAAGRRRLPDPRRWCGRAWNDMVHDQAPARHRARSRCSSPTCRTPRRRGRRWPTPATRPKASAGVAGVTRAIALRPHRRTTPGGPTRSSACWCRWRRARRSTTSRRSPRSSGVDGIFVGPADLAADMGHVGEHGHPEVQAAIEDAITRIRRAGKAPGHPVCRRGPAAALPGAGGAVRGGRGRRGHPGPPDRGPGRPIPDLLDRHPVVACPRNPGYAWVADGRARRPRSARRGPPRSPLRGDAGTAAGGRICRRAQGRARRRPRRGRGGAAARARVPAAGGAAPVGCRPAASRSSRSTACRSW